MTNIRGVRRDLIVFGLFFTLITGVLWIPRAHAETFEESGSIIGAAPATSITLADFETNCAYPPDSQGLDAHIFQIPAALGSGNAVMTATGDALAAYDLDIYFLDASCATVGDELATTAPDEAGPVPAGTLYIAAVNFVGGDVTATISVVGPGGGPGASATPTKSVSPSPSGSIRPSSSPLPPGSVNRTTINTNRARANYKQPFTLSGRVTGDEGCTGPYNVSIRKRISGSNTFTVADPDVPVADDGTWGKTFRSSTSASYTATVASNQSCLGSSSSAKTVSVRVKVTIKKPVNCVDPFDVSGTVLPDHQGTNVFLEQRKGQRWVLLAKAKLAKGSRYKLHTNVCRVPLRVRWPAQSKKNLTGFARIKL